jgi:hypothetical protein
MLIELGTFLVIIVINVASTIFSYLSALCVLKITSFKRLLISSLYMTTFLFTINVFLIIIGACIFLFTGSFEQTMLQVGQTEVPIGNPEFKVDKTIRTIWYVSMELWYRVLSPFLAITANVYVTGISAKKWVLGSIIW